MHKIELEYAFDRRHASKLEQVFAIPVPNRERHLDKSTGLNSIERLLTAYQEEMLS